MEERLSCFTPEQRRKLAQAQAGIAGAGGLGSNVAMMLARSGIGGLMLIDCDIVEASNLNRQHYFPCHIGRPKVDALAEQIRELDAAISVEAMHLRLDAANLPTLLPKADIWVEALDDARTKAMFTALALRAGKPVVSASGMGGFGGRNMSRRVLGASRSLAASTVGNSSGLAENDTREGRAPTEHHRKPSSQPFVIVGDLTADVAQFPPLAPRVIQCAAMQADAVLEWLLTGKVEPLL